MGDAVGSYNIKNGTAIGLEREGGGEREIDGKMRYRRGISSEREREEEEERRRQIHLEIVSASVWPLAYWN